MDGCPELGFSSFSWERPQNLSNLLPKFLVLFVVHPQIASSGILKKAFNQSFIRMVMTTSLLLQKLSRYPETSGSPFPRASIMPCLSLVLISTFL